MHPFMARPSAADYTIFCRVPGIFPGMDLPVQKLDAFPRVALVKGCPGPKAYALVTLSRTVSYPVFLQHFIARDYPFQLPEIGAMHNRNKRDLIDIAESGFKCVIGMEVG